MSASITVTVSLDQFGADDLIAELKLRSTDPVYISDRLADELDSAIRLLKAGNVGIAIETLHALLAERTCGDGAEN